MARPLAYDPLQSLWLQSQHAVGDIPINQMPLEQADAVLEYQKNIFKARCPDPPPMKQGIDMKKYSKQVLDRVQHSAYSMGQELTLDLNYNLDQLTDQAVLNKRKNFAKSYANTYMPVGRESWVVKDGIPVTNSSTPRFVVNKYNARLIPDFEPRGLVLPRKKQCCKSDNLTMQIAKHNYDSIEQSTEHNDISTGTGKTNVKKRIEQKNGKNKIVDYASDKVYGLEPFAPRISRSQKVKKQRQPYLRGGDGNLGMETKVTTSKYNASKKNHDENIYSGEISELEDKNYNEMVRETKYRLHNKIQQSVNFGKKVDEDMRDKELGIKTTKVYKSNKAENKHIVENLEETIEETRSDVLMHENAIKKKKKKERHYGDKHSNRDDTLVELSEELSIGPNPHAKQYEFKPFAQRAMSQIKEAVEENMRHRKEVDPYTRKRKKNKIKQVAITKKYNSDFFNAEIEPEGYAAVSKKSWDRRDKSEEAFDKENIEYNSKYDIEANKKKIKPYSKNKKRVRFNLPKDQIVGEEITN